MGQVQTKKIKAPLLLLDLDDTLFETRTIGKQPVAAILNKFKKSLQHTAYASEMAAIISDIWKYPFDDVAKTYGFDHSTRQKFTDAVNEQHFDLVLSTFPDYHILKQFPRKILVTTGFSALQEAKISALGIREDFESIYIDEIDHPARMCKKGIFETIKDSYEGEVSSFYVIGDNPDSELSAGKALGMTTVQVAKLGQTRSPLADHLINSFDELTTIIS